MSVNCITGYDNHLIEHIKTSMLKAKKIDIIVSFLMTSGIRLLEETLKEVIDKKIPIRILTGNYLGITQPEALYLLKDITGDNVELKFYRESSGKKNRSFHPKAYMFEFENDEGEIYIGSSNISESALTSGIEWNYKFLKENQPADYKYYKEKFEDLFCNEAVDIDDKELEFYDKHWRKPKINVLDDYDTYGLNQPNIKTLFQPRGAQINALYNLKKNRLEGFDKGLVVAATGIGKTYLAAFDSQKFKKILFVAHQEEILKQARATFESIRPNDSSGFFMNTKKDKNVNMLFATTQTLGKDKYLNEEYFEKNRFDYIVIDEFHHAVATTYQKIINYFQPEFLLGLTATPDRMDNKDVFAICDENLVYEISLWSAINKGYLVPFHYYGIYDESIDYSKIKFENGKYNEEELQKALNIHKRAELVIKHYKLHKNKKTLGFCINKGHAEYMAEQFTKAGIPACAVYSGKQKGEYAQDVQEAIKALKEDSIKVIFSVNMFNEGIDIKLVDTVMFLRPTQSPTIFLQQLGRGLRLCNGKSCLNVLDFIGNYKKSEMIPYLLSGDIKKEYKNVETTYLLKNENYPQDCTVNFDMRIIDLFEKMAKEKQSLRDAIIADYFRIKEDLKKRPTRKEFYIYLDDELYFNIKSKPKQNVFKNYLKFLNEIGELDESEKELIQTIGFEFINKIENTSMSKTYKLPILLAFLDENTLVKRIGSKRIFESFQTFYSKQSNAIDLLKDKTSRNYKNWTEENCMKKQPIIQPLKALSNTTKEFFIKKDNELHLVEELTPFLDNDFFVEQFKEVIEYLNWKFYKERLEGK